MDLPEFLRFAPVPLKPRHDGWSPLLQQRFIVLLAAGRSVDHAARMIGKSRATAYALRGREDGKDFAAAWDAALAHAASVRRARALPRLPAPAHDVRSAEAVLDQVCPGWRSVAADLGKADKAGREWHV